MNIKEEFSKQLINSVEGLLDTDTLAKIESRLATLLLSYDVTPTKELPSTDVLDYNYIFNNFIITKCIEGISEKTIETYKIHLRLFFSDPMNQIPLEQITANHIRRHLGLMTSRGNSLSYINDARVILNVFFRYCVQEEYIKSNPVDRVKKIKQNKTIEKPFSDMEVAKLRDACESIREEALVSFLLSTGARREEIIKIKMSEVNMVDRSVLIHGKGNKDRMVYFSATTELALRKYIKSKPFETEYLFTKGKGDYGKLTVSSLRDIIVKIGTRANVPNCHLHRFRKTFATYMVNHGVTIQDLKEMMGHSSIETTNSYYAFANLDHVASQHRQFAS